MAFALRQPQCAASVRSISRDRAEQRRSESRLRDGITCSTNERNELIGLLATSFATTPLTVRSRQALIAQRLLNVPHRYSHTRLRSRQHDHGFPGTKEPIYQRRTTTSMRCGWPLVWPSIDWVYRFRVGRRSLGTAASSSMPPTLNWDLALLRDGETGCDLWASSWTFLDTGHLVMPLTSRYNPHQ
jgi:hypothetical protein